MGTTQEVQFCPWVFGPRAELDFLPGVIFQWCPIQGYIFSRLIFTLIVGQKLILKCNWTDIHWKTSPVWTGPSFIWCKTLMDASRNYAVAASISLTWNKLFTHRRRCTSRYGPTQQGYVLVFCKSVCIIVHVNKTKKHLKECVSILYRSHKLLQQALYFLLSNYYST